MAKIKVTASYFWDSKPAPGEMCTHCKASLDQLAYYPILQMGEADKLNFKDQDKKILLCQKCYSSINT